MKIKRPVHSQGVALTLAASLLAGCGGGGSDSTASAPAASTAVSSAAASASKPNTATSTTTNSASGTSAAGSASTSAPTAVASPAPNPVMPPVAATVPVTAQSNPAAVPPPAVQWPAAKILNAGMLHGFTQTVGAQTITQSGNSATSEKSNLIRYVVAGRAPAGTIENTFDFQWNYSGSGDLEMIRHAGRYSISTTPGSELKSCTVILGDSVGKIPEYGEIGDSAVLLAPRYCTQYNYAANGSLTSATQFNDGFWYSIKKSILPNRVLVCIDSYLDRQTSLYCVRGFEDGTLDTSKVPWLAEDALNTGSTSAGTPAPAPAPAPTPTAAPAPTAMSSLVNMLATISDGSVLTMPTFNYSQAGVYGPEGGLSKISGQALLNATGSVDFYGNKKLSFRWTLTPPYLQMPASLNLRVLNGRIVTWEFSHDLYSNTLLVPANVLSTMDQIGMYAPLSATRVEQQLATAYGNENNQARTPINWQLGYSGDLSEACLYMRRDVYTPPYDPVKFEWCWSHDQSRHRYVTSNKSVRYVYGSDAGFGWAQ